MSKIAERVPIPNDVKKETEKTVIPEKYLEFTQRENIAAKTTKLPNLFFNSPLLFSNVNPPVELSTLNVRGNYQKEFD